MGKDKKPTEDNEVWKNYTKLVTPLNKAKRTWPSHGISPRSNPTHIPQQSRKKLKNLYPQASLDLHGFNLTQAHEALQNFVLSSCHRGFRCVLVITGKGGSSNAHWWEETGVLKNAVPRWLTQEPLKSKIINFTLAKPEHGGSGALYVFCRRKDKVC